MSPKSSDIKAQIEALEKQKLDQYHIKAEAASRVAGFKAKQAKLAENAEKAESVTRLFGPDRPRYPAKTKMAEKHQERLDSWLRSLYEIEEKLPIYQEMEERASQKIQDLQQEIDEKKRYKRNCERRERAKAKKQKEANQEEAIQEEANQEEANQEEAKEANQPVASPQPPFACASRLFVSNKRASRQGLGRELYQAVPPVPEVRPFDLTSPRIGSPTICIVVFCSFLFVFQKIFGHDMLNQKYDRLNQKYDMLSYEGLPRPVRGKVKRLALKMGITVDEALKIYTEFFANVCQYALFLQAFKQTLKETYVRPPSNRSKAALGQQGLEPAHEVGGARRLPQGGTGLKPSVL